MSTLAASHGSPTVRPAVLVTGASRGLGAALVRRFAERGAKVVAVARSAEPLHALATALRAQGHEVYALPADITAPDAATALLGQAAELVGPLDILVNNASTLGPVPLALVADTTPAAFDDALTSNLRAPFALMRGLLGGLLARERGVVVNVSSDAAQSAYPGWGAYGAAKAGLRHLTSIVGAELTQAGSRVRAFSFDPGEMDTELHALALPDAERATLASPAQVAAPLVEFVLAVLAAPERFENGALVQVDELGGAVPHPSTPAVLSAGETSGAVVSA